MFWAGFAVDFVACRAVGLKALFLYEWFQRPAFIASPSPAQRERLWSLRRSRVIGAHSGAYRPGTSPPRNDRGKPAHVAWRCRHLRPSCSNLAQARRAFRAGRTRYDTAIFSKGMSGTHMDGLRRLEHAFVDCRVLERAPHMVSNLDSEGCLARAMSRMASRKRQMNPRSTQVIKVLPRHVPRTRKPAVQC